MAKIGNVSRRGADKCKLCGKKERYAKFIKFPHTRQGKIRRICCGEYWDGK